MVRQKSGQTQKRSRWDFFIRGKTDKNFTMTNKKKIIVYWLLLLIPTILIAGIAFQLILHEQDRIDRAAISSLSERVVAVSDAIQITITGIESELTASLFRIPEKNLKKTLTTWAEINPLVRNVFIWDKNSSIQLQLPPSGMESTNEERQFIKRYDALFTGRIPWQTKKSQSLDEISKHQTNTFIEKVNKFSMERKKLLDLAKPETSMSESEKSDKKQSGWLPWLAENRFFIIGWVQTKKEGSIFGVELELMTILSRLVTELPEINSKNAAYALTGENSQILHQSGAFPINNNQKPEFTLQLSNLLPHWGISVYIDRNRGTTNKGFIYISCLLLAIFVTAIISGGVLLTRQTQRSFKDAREKTTFVSSVSHELKTPLTSIRMYAELLQAGRIKQPEKISHYLSVIVTESQRLTRLVNNILDFGRLEEGKKNYNMENLELSSLLNEVVNIHKLRIAQSGLKLEVSIPDKRIPVHTDRDAIEQVILNLTDNAIKYAGMGEKLIISVDESDPDFYNINLCDFGPGIPTEQTEKIFEKFHRVDNSLTSKQPGSGLGLSIARRILRDLGGDLQYMPGEKSGSCFIIKIRRSS